MLTKKSNIFVTGHKGLVGSAVIRRLTNHGYKNINTITRNKLDLRDQREVFNFFQKKKIDAVINAAGQVGGIFANNKYKADFIYDNLAIQNNIIHACYKNKIKSLIFFSRNSGLGSLNTAFISASSRTIWLTACAIKNFVRL